MTGRQDERKLVPVLSISASAAYLADFEQFHAKTLHHVQERKVALLNMMERLKDRAHRNHRALLAAGLLLRCQRNDPMDDVRSFLLG